MTHLEYEEARRLGIPILIYLIDEESQPVLPKHVDTGYNAELLRALKSDLKKKYTVSFFTTPQDLAKRIAQDLPPIIQTIGSANKKQLCANEKFDFEMEYQGQIYIVPLVTRSMLLDNHANCLGFTI